MMRFAKRLAGTLAGLAIVAGVWSTDLPTASAQQVHVTGPLAGQPAVRHMRMYRQGRIRIQPFAGFSLQDEFTRTMLFGAGLNYSFLDWLGIGVWGAFGPVSFDTSLTDQVGKRGITTDRNALSLPSRQYFDNQIGQIDWMGAVQGTFTPLRGKVSLFQKVFVDTDLSINLGVAFVGVEERADVGQGVCNGKPPLRVDSDGDGRNDQPAQDDPCVRTQFARSSRVAIAPTFGVGLSFYINEFLALAVEWRGIPFKWNTSGTDERGDGPDGDFPDGQINSKDRLFHFNQFVTVGLAIYLPTAAKVTD